MLNILGLLGVTVLLFSTATVSVIYSRKCSVEEAVIEVTTYAMDLQRGLEGIVWN